jgi:hypothetical protein
MVGLMVGIILLSGAIVINGISLMIGLLPRFRKIRLLPVLRICSSMRGLIENDLCLRSVS